MDHPFGKTNTLVLRQWRLRRLLIVAGLLLRGVRRHVLRLRGSLLVVLRDGSHGCLSADQRRAQGGVRIGESVARHRILSRLNGRRRRRVRVLLLLHLLRLVLHQLYLRGAILHQRHLLRHVLRLLLVQVEGRLLQLLGVRPRLRTRGRPLLLELRRLLHVLRPGLLHVRGRPLLVVWRLLLQARLLLLRFSCRPLLRGLRRRLLKLRLLLVRRLLLLGRRLLLFGRRLLLLLAELQ